MCIGCIRLYIGYIRFIRYSLEYSLFFLTEMDVDKKIFDALGLHMGIVGYERKSDSGETLTEKEQTIVYTLEGKFRL